MVTLLIDNSNTRTKFALNKASSEIELFARIPTASLTAQNIKDCLSGVKYDRAVICSVVPEKERLLCGSVGVPVHCVSWKSELSIGITYPEPQQIGADRLANSVSAFHKYGAPCIVIDSGTAVTFDVVKAPGSYEGGVIAPGLGLMTDYFVEKTALLPRLIPEEPKSFIGRSTLEAMNVGTIAGFRGLIREILSGLTRELATRPRIIATGGDADLLFRGVQEIELVDQDLTLEGILRIGLLNSESFVTT